MLAEGPKAGGREPALLGRGASPGGRRDEADRKVEKLQSPGEGIGN